MSLDTGYCGIGVWNRLLLRVDTRTLCMQVHMLLRFPENSFLGRAPSEPTIRVAWRATVEATAGVPEMALSVSRPWTRPA
jgi:hypothetical protein